ncbi:glucuronate isomerase [Candidatus Sumerlaeota bacterium]|nr:glucuronate isomerase [Candidatus Sumerlaeota bacterium]
MTGAAFITEDFLLESERARRLYHGFARDLPIIDYHTHLPPEQIAADHRFGDMAEIWLAEDHYKWRAMRANGVGEHLITGDASPWERFEAWAATVPRLLGNSLHHWAHLELARIFGIDRLLGPDTAREIWEECNARLARPELSCRGIMRRMGLALVCTTDDPVDTLEHHQAIAADTSFDIPVLPTWRPDRAMAVENPEAFNAWVDRLAEAADVDIRDFDSLLEALRRRQAFFHDHGCRLADHGLETIPAEECTGADVREIFIRARGGHALTHEQIRRFQSALIVELGIMNHERGWTQQLHIGPLRNVRTRMHRALGPDTGFDAMGDAEVARPLARFLDRLDRSGQLARTILYHHNPKDSEVMLVLAGCFQEEPHAGKIQVGPPWWFLDQRSGIERQIENLTQLSLLSRFVGMVTDSRSFLSFTRHEYFRRILCNSLGRDMARGLIPDDIEMVGGMVRDVCHGNAAVSVFQATG